MNGIGDWYNTESTSIFKNFKLNKKTKIKIYIDII